MKNSKKISIVTPTYNEIENIHELYDRICKVMAGLPDYEFEFICIDNASTDGTDQELKKLAANDRRLKVIINTRNFGHIRSPYWGIIQSQGDATVYLASDLQDPPELIPEFILRWQTGAKVVLATKPVSTTNKFTHKLRKTYYRFLDAISDVDLVKDTTGFGIYDRVVIDQIKMINDPYPYLRGLICELGYEIQTIDFKQPARMRGLTKNNIASLYDIAMLGITSHSIVPIRLASFFGIVLGITSIILAAVIIIAKLLWWEKFPFGIAPLYILMLFLFGGVFIFLGVLGEYIGSIQCYMQKRPIVVEKERINFEK